MTKIKFLSALAFFSLIIAAPSIADNNGGHGGTGRDTPKNSNSGVSTGNKREVVSEGLVGGHGGNGRTTQTVKIDKK